MSSEGDRYLALRTPEGVVFRLILAGPARRFLAWGVDAAGKAAALMLLGLVLGLLGVIAPDWQRAAGVLTVFFGTLAYNIAFEWLWRGQTLGKFLLGIRVVDVHGLRLQFSQVVLRNLFRTLDIMPGLYLVGGAAMLINRRSQRLGDLVANTVVVRRRNLAMPDLDQLLAEKYNSFREYPHIEARLRQRVSPEEARILVRAVLRREELDAPARVALYAELKEHFSAAAPFPEEATLGLSDEQYLRNLVESIFRRPSGI